MDGCIGVFEVVKFHTKRHRANDACLLFDAAGRAITFEPLVAGQSQYSPSEDLWLLRGGVDAAWAHQPHWRHVPAALAANPEAVLAASGDGDVLWIFGPTPSAEAPPDPALSQHWRQCG